MTPNGGIALCPLTTTWSEYPLASRALLLAIEGYAPAPIAPLPSGMWQPWQTLAYSSSPLCSANLKPPLSVGWDETSYVAFCASAAGETSDSNETISAAKNDSGQADDLDIALHFDGTIVKPRDG